FSQCSWLWWVDSLDSFISSRGVGECLHYSRNTNEKRANAFCVTYPRRRDHAGNDSASVPRARRRASRCTARRRGTAGDGASAGLALVVFLFWPLGPRSVDFFRQALRGLGHVESQRVAIEYRWAEGRSERLLDLATELLQVLLIPWRSDSSPASHGRGETSPGQPLSPTN